MNDSLYQTTVGVATQNQTNGRMHGSEVGPPYTTLMIFENAFII